MRDESRGYLTYHKITKLSFLLRVVNLSKTFDRKVGAGNRWTNHGVSHRVT